MPSPAWLGRRLGDRQLTVGSRVFQPRPPTDPRARLSVLCVAGCLAASMASACQAPVMSRNLSRHCPGAGVGGAGRTAPGWEALPSAMQRQQLCPSWTSDPTETCSAPAFFPVRSVTRASELWLRISGHQELVGSASAQACFGLPVQRALGAPRVVVSYSRTGAETLAQSHWLGKGGEGLLEPNSAECSRFHLVCHWEWEMCSHTRLRCSDHIIIIHALGSERGAVKDYVDSWANWNCLGHMVTPTFFHCLKRHKLGGKV